MTRLTIQPHPQHPDTHSLILVEINGRIRACTWAGCPTQSEALEAWRTDRRAFKPYDESTGSYL